MTKLATQLALVSATLVSRMTKLAARGALLHPACVSPVTAASTPRANDTLLLGVAHLPASITMRRLAILGEMTLVATVLTKRDGALADTVRGVATAKTCTLSRRLRRTSVLQS